MSTPITTSRHYANKVDNFSQQEHWKDKMFSMLFLASEYLPFRAVRVVDVGCGTGALLELIYGHLPTCAVTGIDLNPFMLEKARARKIPKSLFLKSNGSGGIPTADLITCCFVLTHMDCPLAALDSMSRALSPEGVLCLMVPNPIYDRWMAPYNWIKGYKGDPTIQHHFSAKQLASMLEDVGLEVRENDYVGEHVKWLPKINKLRSYTQIIATKKG